jgi:hypothetical protein
MPNTKMNLLTDHEKNKSAASTAFAGGPIAASTLLYGNTTTWREQCVDDFIHLCEVERLYGYDCAELMVRKATEIVERRWQVVQAIANHLLTFRRVRFAQCMRIAEKTLKNKEVLTHT